MSDKFLTMSGDSLRDTLSGGLGDDVFHLDGSGVAVVVEAAGGGNDKVVSNRASRPFCSPTVARPMGSSSRVSSTSSASL